MPGDQPSSIQEPGTSAGRRSRSGSRVVPAPWRPACDVAAEGPLGVAVSADEVALRDLGAQGRLAGAQGGDSLVPPRVARSPENGAATEGLATARPMVQLHDVDWVWLAGSVSV
jgi:hypothetical protein